jgi:hypothetical protein
MAFVRVAGAAQSILTQASRAWPNRSTASDGTLGDASHSSRDSDHNPDGNGIVHAADLTHDPAHGVDAHAWAEAVRRRVKAGQERRVTYQISNRRIYSQNSGWNWVAYDGSNPHEHHVHTSVTDGALQDSTAPWFLPAGGLSVADIGDLLDAIRNQGEMTRDAIRNQGERTRDAITTSSQAQTADIRRAVWRGFGKTSKEIDDLEKAVLAEEPETP